MNQQADVIIIGGGIHGASLAYHLTRMGVRPFILERHFTASGATGRSSGLVRMHYDLEPESRLAWASFAYFRNWADVVGGDCGFTRTGFLQFVEPAYSDQLRANVAMHQQIGIPSLLITPDDVARLAPSFVTDDFEVAAYEPESGYADPSATVTSFLAAARQSGATLVQECEVTAVLSTDSRVTGVRTSKGDFHAPIVVNAAGPWARRVGEMVGLDVPVDTWRHDTLFIRRPTAVGPSHPTVIDMANSMYFRPETGGLTLVGLEDNNPIGLSPDGDAEHAAPDFVDRAVDRICRRIPQMEEGSLHSAHSGFDGITPDQRAILGAAGPEGFYLACGFSGTGFKIGPAVGACMAELIVNGRAQTVDITPFSLDRFSSGQLLKGDHAYANVWH
ncbi:MAG: FAD-binding oxidoreductase [Ardenticatenaceae bacterium]|nr:FAD-binding oxidoreductase [Ardenticatenaceae bacterium]